MRQIKSRMLILEGAMDNLTTQLSRTIISFLKNKDRNQQVFNIQVDDLMLKIFLRPQPNSDSIELNGGLYTPLSKTINITFSIPEDGQIDYAQFNDLIPELKNLLRHELEHYSQDKRGGFSDKLKAHSVTPGSFQGPYKALSSQSSFQEVSNYFLHPTEIEAMVMGLYKQAKTSRKPLSVLLSKKLENIYNNLIAVFEIAEAKSLAMAIKAEWVEFINSRLRKRQ